jgi:glycine dehydrogenase subunit 1
MRYLPHTETERGEMLAAIGVAHIDELFAGVPTGSMPRELFGPSTHKGEAEVERIMSAMAAKNTTAGSVPFFLGGGAYRHHIPAAVDHLIQRSEFLTSYTPYQPEISQGTLQMLFEFQTQVALLTGMDAANASMYDGASACAEAVMMANRVTRRKKAILSGGLHPQYREATVTQSHYTEFEVHAAPQNPLEAEDLAALIDDQTSCVVVQNPDFFGRIKDLKKIAGACHALGALLIVAVAEVVSLGALASPGEMGADIVIGEGQSLGNPLGFGGPYLGLFAARSKFVRQMPGRLCGETVDQDGARGFVLTLSTREQHIRREKATSNICTNSGLCALAFSIHLTLLGEVGLTRLARLNHANAVKLADRVDGIGGAEVINDTFFNEFTLRLPQPAEQVANELTARGVLGGIPVSRLYPGEAALENLLLVTATELTMEDDIEALAGALNRVLA